MSSDHSCLKCYLGDTGLLVSMAFSENELAAGEVQQRLLTGRLEVNAGVIYENLVAQMLRAAGQQLHFYVSLDADSRADRMEIDFLVARSNLTRRHNISPIEVKSGKDYKRHNALGNVLADTNYRIGEAFVLNNENLERDGKITYMPVYMSMFIVPDALPDKLIYRI